MARTLEQLDLAVQALEVQVNRNYKGILQTLQQTALVLEDALNRLKEAVGEPNPPTGLYSSIAALRVLVADLQQRVSNLENP